MPFFDIYLKKFVVEADSAIEAREAASQRWNVQPETMAALLQISHKDTEEALSIAGMICKDSKVVRETWLRLQADGNYDAAQYLLDTYNFMSLAYKSLLRYANNLDAQQHATQKMKLELQTTRAMSPVPLDNPTT